MDIATKPNGFAPHRSADLGDILGAHRVLAALSGPTRVAADRVSTQTPPNAFRELRALGYVNLVPVVPPGAPLSDKSRLSRALANGRDNRGKTPGICGRDGRWSSFNWTNHHPDDAELDRYAAMGAGVGIVTTQQNRLVGVDADTLDPVAAGVVKKILSARVPGAHVPRIGRAPKFLVMLRISGDEDIAYQRAEFVGADGKPERVELLCAGRYFNVLGVHPGTMKPYTWADEIPCFGELPCVTLAQLVELFRAFADALPSGRFMAGKTPSKARDDGKCAAQLKGDYDRVRRAMEVLPNTAEHFPTYDDYIQVGYALRGAGQDWLEQARELWLDWSEKWNGGSNSNAESDWLSFNNPRVGASWLLQKVEQVTGIPTASWWLEVVADTEPTLFDQAPTPPEENNVHFPSVHTVGGRPEINDLPVRSWLIPPWCSSCTVNAVAGAPGVSKSAFALMVAVAVASGVEAVLRGADELSAERLHKSGPVLIYNREDGVDEMRRRVVGLCEYHGLERFPHQLHLASGVDGRRLVIVERSKRGDPIRRAAGYEGLRAKIRELRPVLVILDPLVSLSAGLDENSNDDMEALLAELRALAASERVTIIVVHHAGKNAEKMSGELGALRGASAIAGAVRGGISLTAVRVADTPADGPLKGLAPGRYIVSEGIKSSYGPASDPVVYRLRVINVGNGSDVAAAGETDAAIALRRSGDTVVVHEIVDRRAAQNLAQSARVERMTNDAECAARIIDHILGGRSRASVSPEIDRIADEFIRGGLMRGRSRKAVGEKLSALFPTAGVKTTDESGKSICIFVRQEGAGQKAPLVMRRQENPDDIFE